MRKSLLALAFCIGSYDAAQAQDMPARIYGATPGHVGCQQLAWTMQQRFAVYKAARSVSAPGASGGGRTATAVLRVGITIAPAGTQNPAMTAATAAAVFRSEQSTIRRAMMRRGCGSVVTIRRTDAAVVSPSARAEAATPRRSLVFSMR